MTARRPLVPGEGAAILSVLLTVAAMGLGSAAGASSLSRNDIAADRVSLREVPLRRPAAKGLGCGGAARPVPTELECQPRVAGTWLSRPGTLRAIVWKSAEDRQLRLASVQSVFS